MQIVDKIWRKYPLGCLRTVLFMLPVAYLIWQSLRLLGYAAPTDAPVVLPYVSLFVILVILIIVFQFAAGDACDELQRRRLEKKKHGK
jgi:hypothetical protein